MSQNVGSTRDLDQLWHQGCSTGVFLEQEVIGLCSDVKVFDACQDAGRGYYLRPKTVTHLGEMSSVLVLGTFL